MRTGPYDQWAFGPCFWCSRETYRTRPNSNLPHSYTRDHLIPNKLRRVSLKKVTGRLAHLLTVTCCLECNRKKGGRNPVKFAGIMHLPKEKMAVIHRALSLNS